MFSILLGVLARVLIAGLVLAIGMGDAAFSAEEDRGPVGKPRCGWSKRLEWTCWRPPTPGRVLLTIRWTSIRRLRTRYMSGCYECAVLLGDATLILSGIARMTRRRKAGWRRFWCALVPMFGGYHADALRILATVYGLQGVESREIGRAKARHWLDTVFPKDGANDSGADGSGGSGGGGNGTLGSNTEACGPHPWHDQTTDHNGGGFDGWPRHELGQSYLWIDRQPTKHLTRHKHEGEAMIVWLWPGPETHPVRFDCTQQGPA